MEIEQLIKEYSDELYSKMPIFYQYLEVINAYAGYFGQIEGYLEAKVTDIEEYQLELDYLSIIEICNEILMSLDSKLCDKFNKRISDGTIDFKCDSITSMSIVDKKINITINKTSTIEDVLGLIHEFFHSIHIEKYDNDMQNQEWYFFTEAIAMTGELYAILYMYKNNILKEDLNSYLKKYISTMFAHASNTLLTGLTLEIYDDEQSLSDVAVNHFISVKQLPEGYNEITEVIQYLDDFLFHESATYTFGFPIALLIASKMLDDEEYKIRLLSLLEHINEYDLDNLLTSLGIKNIIKNEDYMCDAMNYVYSVVNEMLDDRQLDIKSLLIEMR